MSLTQTEQRICDLAQQINVQQEKVAEAKNALLNNTKLTPDESFVELVRIRAAQAKIDTITEEYNKLRDEYVTERLDHPVLSKVLRTYAV